MLRAVVAIGMLGLAASGLQRLNAGRHGLDAEYFANPNWQPPAARSARDRDLTTSRLVEDWGRTDPFSAKWTGWLDTLLDRDYSFAVSSDGESSLFIDNVPVVHDQRRQSQPAIASIHLASGSHRVFIQYAHDRGPIRFDVSWSRDGRPFEIIPTANLSPRRATNRVAVIASVALIPAVLALCEWLWILAAIALAATLAWRGGLAVKRSFGRQDLWQMLRWILLGSFVLNLLGIWWGLPGTWVPIEVLPKYVIEALRQHFSHGWFDAYPPLHYMVLGIVMAPLLWLSWCGRIVFENVYGLALLLSRLVSVAAGVGTVAATCAAGARAFGRRAGLWAAGMMALTTPFLYYAKTANVDVPYLFWFAVSLVYYVRILRGGTLRDYVLFAACATCSVCTKDQAYGLYLLMPIPIVVEIWRANRSAEQRRPFLKALIDRRLWTAAAASAVLFALIHNIAFNRDGFIGHVKFLVGDGSVPYRVFEPTFAGRWQLLLLTLDLTEQALGWPFTVIVLCGLAIALARSHVRRMAIWLLVPAVGYYVTFIDVIVYNYDRFMLPVCLILAIFGGLALDALAARRSPLPAPRSPLPVPRPWRLALASAVFAYTLLYAGAVDYLMIRDSRYDVQRWLRAHVGPSQLVGSSGTREYIPVLDGFNHVDISDLEKLARFHPAYMLINADYGRAVSRETDWGQLIEALERGTAGYKLVARFRQPLPWAWLPGMHRDLTGPRLETMVFTTVRNINPTIEVFAPAPVAR